MADRIVIVRQVIRRRVTFATAVMDGVMAGGKYKYFLFGTSDQTKAKRFKEKEALRVLDSWRKENITNANNCSLEPAS